MKRRSHLILCSLLVAALLAAALSSAAEARALKSGYAAYDLAVSELMAEQNDLFELALQVMQNLSLDAVTSADAVGALNDLRSQAAAVDGRLRALKGTGSFKALHEKYRAFSRGILSTVDKFRERARSYDPSGQDSYRLFLTATVRDAFEMSRMNVGIMNDILDLIRNEDFSGEKSDVREFYRWQKATLPIDIYITGNFVDAHLYINEMFADESTIRTGAEKLRTLVTLVDKDAADLKARIQNAGAPESLKELHRQWQGTHLKALGFFIIARSMFDAASQELFRTDLEKLGTLSQRVAELMKSMDAATLRYMKERF